MKSIQKHDQRPHSDTAAALLSVANMHFKLGDCNQSSSFHSQSLKMHAELRIHLDLAWQGMGDSFLCKHEAAKALESYKKSLQIFAKTAANGNKRTSIQLLNKMGLCHFELGELELALAYFRQALDMTHRISEGFDRFQTGHTNNNIVSNTADVYFTMRIYSKAVEFYQIALQKETKRNFGRLHFRHRNLLTRLAESYERLGRIDDALKYHNESLQLIDQSNVDSRREVAEALSSIGVCLRVKGKLAESLIYLNKSLEIKRQCNMPSWQLAKSFSLIAEVHLTQAKYSQALSYFSHSLGYIQNISELTDEMKETKVLALHGMGKAHGKIEHFELAVKHLRQALEIKSQMRNTSENNEDLSLLYANLGDVYREASDARRAFSCYKQSIQARLYSMDGSSWVINLDTLLNQLESIFEQLNEADKVLQTPFLNEIRQLRYKLTKEDL